MNGNVLNLHETAACVTFDGNSFKSIVQELKGLRQTFDQWYLLRKNQCIENKKHFTKSLTNQHELLKKLKAEIEHLHLEKAELDQVLLAESKEEASLASQNDKLTAQINSQQQKLAELRQSKQKLSRDINSISVGIQAAKQEKMAIHSELFPKIETLKQVLGLEISSPGVNLVKFTFFNLVFHDSQIKCWLFLKVAENESKMEITETFPASVASSSFSEEMLKSLASGKCNLMRFCAAFRGKFQEILSLERQSVNKEAE